MPIKTKLNNDMLATLTAGAQVLEEDSLGPKVYRLADGNFQALQTQASDLFGAVRSLFGSLLAQRRATEGTGHCHSHRWNCIG